MAETTPAPRRLITGYVPTLSLTIVALAAFGLLAAAFLFNFFKYGRQRYLLTLTIGTICMVIGFIARIPMTNDPSSLIIYILTTLASLIFTLLSPCAFLAHDYVVLPRLATWLDAADCLFYSPRLIAKTFIWIDVTVFLLQAGGSGMTAIDNQSISNVGLKICLVGLIAQVISFGVFMLIAIVFGFRVRSRYPEKWTSLVRSSSGTSTKLSWRRDWRVLYYALLWTTIGIMVRCIFRVAEYAEGYSGKLRTTEWYIYVFDTLPIFLAIAIWAVVWPAVYINNGPHPFTAVIGSDPVGSSRYGVHSTTGYESGYMMMSVGPEGKRVESNDSV